MRRSRRLCWLAIGVAAVGFGLVAAPTPAAADTMTNIPSFTDTRTDDPPRPACTFPAPDTCIKRGLYGPYTIPASGEIHNQINFTAPAPCTNCYITDMVANLVDGSTGNPVNLQQNVMLHHFVLSDASQQDVVCPSFPLGRRFFAAGNERTHMHLPSPYGYFNTASTWRLTYHLVNKSVAPRMVNIEIVYKYRQTGLAATPLWLDIDGCPAGPGTGDSEYTAPLGHSDVHSDWTADRDGRFIGLAGHLHDVDITNLQLCVNSTDDDADTRANDGCPPLAAAEAGAQCTDTADSDGDGRVNDGCAAWGVAETQCADTTDNDSDGRINDGCPAMGAAETACTDATDNDSDGRVNDGCPIDEAVEGPCVDHCAHKGHGIAVSVELVGGPSSHYHGPLPPNAAPPTDLAGATICRSEGYYGTAWAGTAWRQHLDTMSLCGVFNELPGGHQTEPYPPAGEFPIDGYPLKQGDVIRLHTEYRNDTGTPQTDVMGIVMAWIAPATPGYARPKAASPSTVRLVPAYNQCTSANASHAAPLANPSCSPPVLTSGYLTVGTPDANGQAANSSGIVKLKVVGESPIDPNNGDQADVEVTGQITDVRRKANPAQTYSGQVQLRSTVRITDRYNVTDQATVQDVPFNITGTCTNGNCNMTTSFDAVLEDVIREGKRAIWELGQVRVFDGGADGQVSTADNTLFAVQGLFAP